MFEGLGIVEKIINEMELEIYTLDDKENIIVSASSDYILSIKDEVESGEVIIISYDKENKIINEDVKTI